MFSLVSTRTVLGATGFLNNLKLLLESYGYIKGRTLLVLCYTLHMVKVIKYFKSLENYGIKNNSPTRGLGYSVLFSHPFIFMCSCDIYADLSSFLSLLE